LLRESERIRLKKQEKYSRERKIFTRVSRKTLRPKNATEESLNQHAGFPRSDHSLQTLYAQAEGRAALRAAKRPAVMDAAQEPAWLAVTVV
jgi:hypothetical protein